MKDHVFAGFGFGPIQAGLFAAEAFKSGNFSRIVIAEIDQEVVEAVRANNGSYSVNIASDRGISTERIDGIEVLNPENNADREELVKVLSTATEISTSLPSVSFYKTGADISTSSLIRGGLSGSTVPGVIIYTAENNNRAAEILEESTGRFSNAQFLNTVIGKMSQSLKGREKMESKGLEPIAPGLDRAFLVEKFNRILVTMCTLTDFSPGIDVFLEKEDLLPFEEAKLYGHNAVHALLGFLGAAAGYSGMKELADSRELMNIARKAFLDESGAALISKYRDSGDKLFTETGFRNYAEDLLGRMTNPYLDDPVDRPARDPRRKLAPDDRIFGTMKLALEYGVTPRNMALGAAAGIRYLAEIEGRPSTPQSYTEILLGLFAGEQSKYKQRMIELTEEALRISAE